MRQTYVHDREHQPYGNQPSLGIIRRQRGVHRLTQGEKSARFKRLVEPHLDAAYNYARWLARNDNDAEDVTHDAILRALEYFDTFKGEHIPAVAPASYATPSTPG
jgi:hypothetical protein